MQATLESMMDQLGIVILPYGASMADLSREDRWIQTMATNGTTTGKAKLARLLADRVSSL